MNQLIEAFHNCSVEVDIRKSTSFFRVRETIRRIVMTNDPTVPACFLCCVDDKWFISPTDFLLCVESGSEIIPEVDNNISLYVSNLLCKWGAVSIDESKRLKNVVSPKHMDLTVLKFLDPTVDFLQKLDFKKILPKLQSYEQDSEHD